MKSIVSCSVCKKNMRIPIDKHIKFTCAQCGAQIIANKGVIISTHKKTKPSSSSNYRNRNYKNTTNISPLQLKLSQWSTTTWMMVIGGLIVSFLTICYVNSQVEKWAFAKATELVSINSLEQFLKDYPNGQYNRYDSSKL